MTDAQKLLKEKHGTPKEFEQAAYAAVPSMISFQEAQVAVEKYFREWEEAGPKTESPYRNGSVWECQWPACHRAVLQVLPGGKYALLAFGEGNWALNVITDPDGSGKWQYTDDELPARLKNWRYLPYTVLEERELEQPTNPAENRTE